MLIPKISIKLSVENKAHFCFVFETKLREDLIPKCYSAKILR